MKGYNVYTSFTNSDFVLCDKIEINQGFVIMKTYKDEVVAMYQSHMIVRIKEVES